MNSIKGAQSCPWKAIGLDLGRAFAASVRIYSLMWGQIALLLERVLLILPCFWSYSVDTRIVRRNGGVNIQDLKQTSANINPIRPDLGHLLAGSKSVLRMTANR